jgi:hypothetical protein
VEAVFVRDGRTVVLLMDGVLLGSALLALVLTVLTVGVVRRTGIRCGGYGAAPTP